MSDSPAPAPRRLLVLAASGAFGGGMRDQERARLWPDLVRDSLAASVGEVELTLRRFYVHGGAPSAVLERELTRVQPDYIVLQCTSFPATQRTVAHRVEHLLGKRAGDWTEARVRVFDRNTRRRGPVRRRLNRISHRVARRVIGTAPIIGYGPLVEGYLRAIDRIAMVETADVAVIGTGYASKSARENNPDVDTIKARFDREIAEAARRKHLGWVDSAAITRESANPEATFLDQLHKGQEWHDGLAARIVAALLRE